MRVLALDYGSARCGCALSDPTGTIVTPLEAVERPATRAGMAALAALAAERGAELVLVGLPLSLSGQDSEQTREARAFAERLAAGAPLAIRYTKLAVNKWIKDVANVAFDTSTALEIVTFQSEDHREALAAIRDKRKPDFKGR